MTSWFPALVERIQSVGPRLALGVVLFSLGAALIAYGTVHIAFKLWAGVMRPRDR